MIQKSNNQAVFHFLVCQLIVECTENIKNHNEIDSKLKQIGRQIGFKIYNQIALKRGILERPSSLVEIFKNIKTKVFKHLFNYQMSAELNSYKIQGKRAVIYGLIDEVAVYLSWMPENVHLTVGSLICGIIETVCKKSDLECSVSCQTLVNEKEEKNMIQYLVQIEDEEHSKWDKK